MDYWADAPLRWTVLAALTLYIFLGSIGVFYISDDFDIQRQLFYQNIGFPLMISLYCFWLFLNEKVVENRKLAYALIVANILAFSWGNWVLVDYTLGATNTEQIIGNRGMSYTKGITGRFYEARW